MDRDEPPKELSLSDVRDALELIERWSQDEVRKSLYHIPKKLDKKYLAKKQKKISDFFIPL